MVTAKLRVKNKLNQWVDSRALLDTCSTNNFMTECLASRLKLPRQNFAASIGALNTMSTQTKHIVTATIRSRICEEKRTLSFLVVPNISSIIPSQALDRDKINIPSDIDLADPDFHIPAPVDMLIGTGSTLSFLQSQKRQISPRGQPELILIETSLGWIIGGGAPVKGSQKLSCHMTNSTDDANLTRFWEIEEPVSMSTSTEDKNVCEHHFTENTTRDSTGRFTVALPFNDKLASLGESRSQAFRRFKSCENKLKEDDHFAAQYTTVIQEDINLGHMSELHPASLSDQGYYLPHHAVIKHSSLTTKLRVVFGGSAKTTTGISLNESLHVGPTIQDDIFTLLLRFRMHRYVLTADIEKMYRQVLVRPEDRKYQRILWRNDGDGPVRTDQLNTVTFGLSAAPWLAVRCLHQLADDEGRQFPVGARILKQDFYVDDLLSGADTQEEAIVIRDQLDKLVKLGGFNIRQWASNEPTLLQDLPAGDINRHLQLGDSTTLKTLGVSWDSAIDSIGYLVKLETPKTTKRIILSETAKIFDPLGLLAPVIVIAKAFIQKLWLEKIHWDTPLSSPLEEEWLHFYEQLPVLEQFQVPRGAVPKDATTLQLHGFCDASFMAYGACIYLRAEDKHGHVQVTLLCAKSKVAPLAKQTIPRLELCGAQLLATLMTRVQSAINLKNINQTFFWTDSTIVLHWLHTTATKLPVFINNRVLDIQQKTLAIGDMSELTRILLT